MYTWTVSWGRSRRTNFLQDIKHHKTGFPVDFPCRILLWTWNQWWNWIDALQAFLFMFFPSAKAMWTQATGIPHILRRPESREGLAALDNWREGLGPFQRALDVHIWWSHLEVFLSVGFRHEKYVDNSWQFNSYCNTCLYDFYTTFTWFYMY